MNLYLILSRLLDYPSQELYDNLGQIEALITDIDDAEKSTIMSLVNWMGGQDITSLQGTYVNTFDMKPEHDLHLTHHLFGDENGRGPALIDLAEHYKASGLQHIDNEIPDFLPLILEYVSTLDKFQARVFLADAAKVLKVIADNLAKAQSPYAGILRLIENRGYLAEAA